jgi:hypothetical protein
MATLVEYSELSHVHALEARLQEATRSNDVRALEELIHPSAPIMSAGAYYSPRSVIAAHESRRICLSQLRLVGDLTVGHLRGGLVASFRMVMKGTVDGRVCDGVYVYERLWRQTLRGWQVVSMKVTPQAS